MKLIIMAVICCLTSNLFRGSFRRCHAWTTAVRAGISTIRRNDAATRNYCFRYNTRTQKFNNDRCFHRIHINQNNRGHKHRIFLCHSTWTGDMAPFSEYATHVKVAEDDGPTSVESAIFKSMTTLGSSYVLSSDGGTYVECNTMDGENNQNSLLILEDTHNDGIDNEIDEGIILAHKLKDHPPNSPMTPRQLLHLGCVWYLSAENFGKNEELKREATLTEDAKKFLFLTKNMTKSNDGSSGNAGKKQNQKRNGMEKVIKPRRLTLGDATMEIREGDYLRIHHTPRRFPMVHSVDWSLPDSKRGSNGPTDGNDVKDTLPLVVQQEGPGYCIIDKPPIIPVHASVDNAFENVAHQLYLSLERKQQQQQQQQRNATLVPTDGAKDGINVTISHLAHREQVDQPYLAAVQRLDVNTSGLMVVATSPEFAAYFSQLLRYKTATILHHKNNTNAHSNATSPTIEKGYKCLVCIQPDETSGESVIDAWKRLSSLHRPKQNDTASSRVNPNSTNIIRHFLQASDRAPKLFVDSIPEGDDDSKWYECLMEITHVGDPVPLYASNSEDGTTSNLADSLWPKYGSTTSDNSRMPSTAKAVVEVQVSLITGRTHQIRGQLSKLGFPIVGDEQYGGAFSEPSTSGQESISRQDPENQQLLALQCCQLGFRDAEYESVWNKKKRRDVLKGRPSRSGKWVRASLQNAWWTPFLNAQLVENDGGQSSDIDFQDAVLDENISSNPIGDVSSAVATSDTEIRSDMLPPTVQLSPGRNKYVLAKFRDPATHKTRWFVQSAPLPYHAEVAFDLLEWIAAVPGYEQTRVQVTGGGRIDYNPSASTVTVYGFSYRYGKGDHERVANLIENSDVGADLTVSFDLSDNLY